MLVSEIKPEYVRKLLSFASQAIPDVYETRLVVVILTS